MVLGFAGRCQKIGCPGYHTMRQWHGLEINIDSPCARRRVQLKIPDLGKVGLIPFAPRVPAPLVPLVLVPLVPLALVPLVPLALVASTSCCTTSPIATPIANAIAKLINNVMIFGCIAKSFNSTIYFYIKTFAFSDIKLVGRHLRTEEKSKDRLQGILDDDGVI
jgi:hypothetical protein